jgi:uncharacterized protein (TIGR03084 family)
VDEELDALAAQHAELEGLVEGLDDAGWAASSRCEGWTVADVLLHLAQTDEMALASLDGRLDAFLTEVADDWAAAASVDDGAGLLVAAERDRQSPTELHRRWLEGSAALRAAFATADERKRVQWVAGTLSVRTLAVTRLTECWIHSGDVAHGLGVALPPTDRLRHTVRLAWRTLPYAFAQAGRELHGPVAFHLSAPGGGEWRFDPADGARAATTVLGPAAELCEVAGQRASAADTSLVASGPDAADVLALVRTFA